jgi:RHS repeat-associated protein
LTDTGSQSCRHYPYGQENATTANDTAKYATYTRDASTGLDYARNRYYTSTWGRFTTADPYQASGGVADPQSWNRYAYVEGDPVSYMDPRGLEKSSKGVDFCVTFFAFAMDEIIIYADLTRIADGDERLPGGGSVQGRGGAPTRPSITASNVTREGPNQDSNQDSINAALFSVREFIDDDCKTWLQTGAVKDFAQLVSQVAQPPTYVLRDVDKMQLSEPGFTHDGRWLTLSANGQMLRYDCRLGIRTELGRGESPSLSPQGDRLLFENASKNLIIRDMRTGSERSIGRSQGEEPAWSPDGDRILYFRPIPYTVLGNAEVVIYDLRNGQTQVLGSILTLGGRYWWLRSE